MGALFAHTRHSRNRGRLQINPGVTAATDFEQRLQSWRDLSVGFNELNRSMGLNDAYPFVINDKVAEKLRFADVVTDAVKTLDLDSVAAPPLS